MVSFTLPPKDRAQGVTAMLGPTNTGKTHFAIERMLGHPSGIIGLPLRLLAREVYGRVVERVGAPAVALVTGEEKIKPPGARYWIATVEAMPRDINVSFVAIDEVQLAADFDRGHIFTDRVLNMRGREETLLIGAQTIRSLLEALIPGIAITSRPRFSNLLFAGEKKISRLPRRTAIVAFSAEEVYAIAELIRRQSGGAAVVLGALSPRTRNAQVALYQSGDVDYLVATDAVGMGLNLDVDHVAFAGDRKFDGTKFRRLVPAEFSQIAGRAGRHLKDGTFGTTGRCAPFDPELAEALEAHAFDPLTMLQWRNTDLEFRSLPALIGSLDRVPDEPGLTRAPLADDLRSLETAARDREIRDLATGRSAVERLWEACQIPDYRKVSPAAHAELVSTVYRSLMKRGHLPEDWFSRQLAEVDRTDGDIDTLSARIAQVRTWTFVANRGDWLRDPVHWQEITRKVEDALSDALHERLAQRFVDRRTSILMRRLREKTMLEAEISPEGDVLVEAHHVGRLIGFQFIPDSDTGAPEGKALRAAAIKALAGHFSNRAVRVSNAVDEAFTLANDGSLRYAGEPIARLSAGEKILDPKLRILADEHLDAPSRDLVQARIDLWLKRHVEKLLGALLKLEAAESLTGIARGIAFQIAESLGVLDRSHVADDMKTLDQDGRAALRTLGVRFGAYHLTVPALLKPAPRALAAQLWALREGGAEVTGLDDILHLAASGRTSIPVDPVVPKPLYRAAGFRVCGARAVRVDILERLADLIRPAIQFRPGLISGEPPPGAADGDGFVVTTAMTSLCGCAGEDFATILTSLGYSVEKRTGPAITLAPKPAAAVVDASESGKTATAANETAPSEGETPVVDAELEASVEPIADTATDENTAAATAEQAITSEPAAAGPVDDLAGAPQEPVLIEVWRQKRHQPQGHRHARHKPRPGNRPAQNGQSVATPAAEANATPQGEQAPASDRSETQGHRPQRDRRDGANGQDERRGPRQPRPETRDRRPERAGEDRPHADRPRGDRPGQDRPRHDRANRDEGRRQDRGWQDPPRAAATAIDPDSPFAKLLALKAEMESRVKR